MGVAQRADVPAVVPVGSVLRRLGYAAVDIWRRAVRETRLPTLAAHETRVKPQPRPQCCNPA